MTEEQLLASSDAAEYRRLKQVINARNVHLLDRDTRYLKEWGQYEVALYDYLQMSVTNTFMFTSDDAAKAAIEFVTRQYDD